AETLDANLQNLILPYQPAHVFVCGLNKLGDDALQKKWGPWLKGVNFSPHPRNNPLLYTTQTAGDIQARLKITEQEFNSNPAFHRSVFNESSTSPWCLV
ncbi:unnamed protein product, partial [Amoebophrya sp. A25]